MDTKCLYTGGFSHLFTTAVEGNITSILCMCVLQGRVMEASGQEQLRAKGFINYMMTACGVRKTCPGALCSGGYSSHVTTGKMLLQLQ